VARVFIGAQVSQLEVIDFCPCCQSGDIQKTDGVIAPFITNRIYGWPIVSWPVITLRQFFGDSWPVKLLGTLFAQRFSAKMQTGVIVCSKCGFVCCDVRFDDDELSRYYVDYMGPTYLAHRIAAEPWFSSIANRIAGSEEIAVRHAQMQQFLSNRLGAFLDSTERVLDYGGGDGRAIPKSAFKNATKFVLDISNKPLKNDVHKIASLRDEQPFDFVICSHVLEHVSFPGKIVDDIISGMRPKAWLYVELPGDIVGLQDMKPEDIKPEMFSGILFHEHINHFSCAALRTLLTSKGLKVETVESFPVDLGWVRQHFIRALAALN
jgi:SAM-dependent methyltransferase